MEFDDEDGLHQDDEVKVAAQEKSVEGCVRMRRTGKFVGTGITT